MRYRFGSCEVNLVLRQLSVNGQLHEVGGRAFDLLVALIERREQVVSPRELLRQVWPEHSVQTNNLRVQIWNLRRLLGPSTIVTVARRGYCFTGEVEVLDAVANDAAGGAPAPATLADPPQVDRPSGWRISEGDVCEALSGHRLVTLVGAEEIGRRALVHAVAARLGSASIAMWRMSARGLVHGRAEIDRVLREQMRRVGREDAVLALLNCHQAGPDLPDALSALLQRHTQLRVLATSAAALRLPAEKVLWTRPVVPFRVGRDEREGTCPGLSRLRWHSRRAL